VSTVPLEPFKNNKSREINLIAVKNKSNIFGQPTASKIQYEPKFLLYLTLIIEMPLRYAKDIFLMKKAIVGLEPKKIQPNF
jgi:hypothetical protein